MIHSCCLIFLKSKQHFLCPVKPAPESGGEEPEAPEVPETFSVEIEEEPKKTTKKTASKKKDEE